MASPEAVGNKPLINIVKYRFWWFALSAVLIIPGIVAMIYSSMIYPTHAPLKVGIDYTGGTILQYSIDKPITSKEITQTGINLEAAGIENILCKSLGSNTPANVVKATVMGLKELRTVSQAARFRGKTVAQLTGQEEA